MALFDRLSRVVRANLNDMVAQAEDPEEALERALINMEEDLVQLRQAVARSIAEQKRTEQKYNQDLAEANKWEQRAKLALFKGDENVAREALTRKKSHTDTTTVLKQQLELQTTQLNSLRQNLAVLEGKISDTKTKKSMLQARARAKAEDPEKVLEQAVIDMQEDLVQLRQAIARSIAEQKRTEQKYNQDLAEAGKWEQRAKLALFKRDENLAREALTRKKSHTDTATVLKQQLDGQTAQVDNLRKNLVALEGKISEAKTKKNMLQARATAAKANEQLQKTLGNIDVNITKCAFERIEARSIAIGELGGFGIEQQFAELEAGSDVDDELAMMKAQMLDGYKSQEALLEASETSLSSASNSIVDAELEELRAKLKNL